MIRRIWLFCRIVWRKFDAPSIPKPYRCDDRISWKLAWEVAKIIHR